LHCPKGTSGNKICQEVGEPEHNFANSYFSARAWSLLTGLVVPSLKEFQHPTFHPSYISTWNLTFSFPSKAPVATYAPTGINKGRFNEYFHYNFPSYVHIYTDGSKYSNGFTATAAAMYIPSLQSATTWRLNPAHTVIKSELFAILKAMELCCLDPRLTRLRKYTAVNRFPVSIACNQ
jgi:hypothetical protein